MHYAWSLIAANDTTAGSLFAASLRTQLASSHIPQAQIAIAEYEMKTFDTITIQGFLCLYFIPCLFYMCLFLLILLLNLLYYNGFSPLLIQIFLFPYIDPVPWGSDMMDSTVFGKSKQAIITLYLVYLVKVIIKRSSRYPRFINAFYTVPNFRQAVFSVP